LSCCLPALYQRQYTSGKTSIPAKPDRNSLSRHSFSFKGIYEKTIIPGFRASVRSGGNFRPGTPPLLESTPDEAEITIFPGRFPPGIMRGFRFATISLYDTGQIAHSNGPIIGDRFDYGVTGSLKEIPFTNNKAERALRMMKVQQNISGKVESYRNFLFVPRIFQSIGLRLFSNISNCRCIAS
jgi:hypothetical protein